MAPSSGALSIVTLVIKKSCITGQYNQWLLCCLLSFKLYLLNGSPEYCRRFHSLWMDLPNVQGSFVAVEWPLSVRFVLQIDIFISFPHSPRLFTYCNGSSLRVRVEVVSQLHRKECFKSNCIVNCMFFLRKPRNDNIKILRCLYEVLSLFLARGIMYCPPVIIGKFWSLYSLATLFGRPFCLLTLISNQPITWKYPVSSSCADKNALMMWEVRAEWADWFEMI